MQKQGEKFKKKPKQKVFTKKIGIVDLETQEAAENQAKYDSINIKEVQTFADLPLSKKTLKGLK